MNILKFSVFRGISEAEYNDIQNKAYIRQKEYKREGIIFHAGDRVTEIGMVISGSVNIETVDVWGNRSILSNVSAGQVFAESYVFSYTAMMVDVVAAEDCVVAFLELGPLHDANNAELSWYPKLIRNFLAILANKNIVLSNRIFCTSPKTVRERVMTYLSNESKNCGSRYITIPFDRQQMADYLNVERTALSKELGRMKRDGILEYHKNEFRLLDVEN